MRTFSYIARDMQGNVVKDIISAQDKNEALQKLISKGLYVSRCDAAVSRQAKTIKKFKTSELAYNCRQLSAMMSAGLTLVKALDILHKEQPNEASKQVWRTVYEDVQKGQSFSDSLKAHEGVFPNFLVSMVTAGESSGSLDVVMNRMSDHYAKEAKLNNKIKGAMVYPIVLLCLSVVIVIGLFTFIMPTFMDLFEGTEMPALTKIMMGFSSFLRSKWYIVLMIVSALVFVAVYLFKVPDVRFKIDRLIIKGPYFGKLVTKVYTARFSRTLSSLYSSGIPMVECIERSVAILGNSYISKEFEQVIDDVKQGEPLSLAVQKTGVFDSMFCSIIFVGEEAGALDDILTKTSDYYDEESESAIQRLVTMIEPIMIIFLGVMVGLIIAAVVPAIYSAYGDMNF